MISQFEQDLKRSLYVHSPLCCDESKTLESQMARKTVLKSWQLWDGKDLRRWRFDGEGQAAAYDGMLVMVSQAAADHWPESEVRAVDAERGVYATFGSYEAKLDVSSFDLAQANCMSFEIRPLCNGLHSPIVRAAFVNNGEIKIPDAYSREGFNAINLKNFQWNTCKWEIGSIAHDKVEEVSFIMHRYGKEVSGGDELRFEIRNIRFEQLEDPFVVHGWQCRPETAAYSTSGYFCQGTKTAIANTTADRFQLLDAETGAVVLDSPIKTVHNQLGVFSVLDFSAVCTPGRYCLRFGQTVTSDFAIADDVMESAVWKLINFLFCERCGFPVPGKHGTCHADVTAVHNGLRLVYQGGWHDAADVSQEMVQSGETVDALLEAAQSVRQSNPLLYARLMEEANWGLDFVLRSRFGDGYRATGASIRRWTDGMIGGMDDCPARVQNNSFINFQLAGIEAEAALAFAEQDPALSWKCRDAAREDFAFACERFRAVGVEAYLAGEHSSSNAKSHYYAAACLAAARLYQATGQDCYQQSVADFAAELLACQEDGRAGLPMRGFFYRDESRTCIVHSSHQSRDQLFVQALTAACVALPKHPKRSDWERGMRLHGEYLKELMSYTAPYGMLPSGLYQMSELDDEEAFLRVHPCVDFQQERLNYKEQLEAGVSVGQDCYLRRFPVWFSYRGNSGILLSMGKSASLLGRYFHDEELIQIAREQLYWTLGKNPFGQSLIYGEGENYGQQYAALLGETVGEMAVGVQTRANEDLPYWPQANIATYREVWTTPPSRWLWIIADILSV